MNRRSVPLAVALLVTLAAGTAGVVATSAAGTTTDLNLARNGNVPVETPTEEPTETPTETPTESPTDTPPDVRAISYVAVCDFASDVTADDVAIVDVDLDDEGEPIAVTWSSAVDVGSVVIKFATNQLVFEYPGDDDFGDTVGPADPDGEPISEPNSDPCPGDVSGFKFEADDGFETAEQVN